MMVARKMVSEVENDEFNVHVTVKIVLQTQEMYRMINTTTLAPRHRIFVFFSAA